MLLLKSIPSRRLFSLSSLSLRRLSSLQSSSRPQLSQAQPQPDNPESQTESMKKTFKELRHKEFSLQKELKNEWLLHEALHEERRKIDELEVNLSRLTRERADWKWEARLRLQDISDQLDGLQEKEKDLMSAIVMVMERGWQMDKERVEKVTGWKMPYERSTFEEWKEGKKLEREKDKGARKNDSKSEQEQAEADMRTQITLDQVQFASEAFVRRMEYADMCSYLDAPDDTEIEASTDQAQEVAK